MLDLQEAAGLPFFVIAFAKLSYYNKGKEDKVMQSLQRVVLGFLAVLAFFSLFTHGGH